MRQRRHLLPALVVTSLVAGTLGGTAAYALYFRTERYRHRVEARLTDFFQLPTEVGGIDPHTFHSRVIRDIRIWLPDRRDRVFLSPAAIWHQSGPRERPAVQIDVMGGKLTIGSEQWLPEDYWRVLRAAFSRNIEEMDLREVRFNGVDFIWPRRDLHMTAENVTGRVVFDEQHRGEATLVAQSLNGNEVEEPVHIFARVLPLADDFLPEVRLTLPILPISVLNLGSLLGHPVRAGRFGGTVTYRQQGSVQTVQISGQAEDVDLSELTAALPYGPVPGRVTLRIHDALVPTPFDAERASVRFSARIEDLAFGPLASRLGYPEIRGRARLMIHQAQFDGRRVREFVLSGRLDEIPLDEASRRMGIGVVTGRLSVRLNSLHVADDQIVLLDADVDVAPPPGGGTIDRVLLLGLFEEYVGIPLPKDMLPERIGFVQMGGRILVNNGRMRILGAQSTGRQSILTLQVLGQELPIPPPAGTFSIQHVLDQFQAKARGLDLETLRRWWRQSAPQTAPVTQPASALEGPG